MSLGELHANEPPQPCVARDIKAAVTLIPRWGESRTETLGLGIDDDQAREGTKLLPFSHLSHLLLYWDLFHQLLWVSSSMTPSRTAYGMPVANIPSNGIEADAGE